MVKTAPYPKPPKKKPAVPYSRLFLFGTDVPEIDGSRLRYCGGNDRNFPYPEEVVAWDSNRKKQRVSS